MGATGTAPLAYEWQKNGTNISGATAASFTTAAMTTADSGSTFDVVVSNTAGSVTSTTATLTVTPATLVSIAVTPANPSVAKGTTQQFKAIGTFSDASTQDLTTTATWASGAPAVATIGVNTGLATAVGTSSTNITAVQSGVTSNTAVLAVTAAVLQSIAVTPAANPSVAKGQTQQFKAIGTFSDASTQDLTTTATWASGTPTVGTIGVNTGLATAVGTGSTNIIAAQSGVTSNTAVLAVTAAVLQSIAVTPASPSTLDGQSQQFIATGTNGDGSTQDLTASVTWTSLNTSVATITSGGLAMGIAAGSAQIQAASGSIIGSTTLTVTAPTLVQHVSGSSTRNNGFTSPFCYFYQLPALTTAGNSVVVGFTFKNKPTPTVTDDKGDSYTIAENFFDSTDGQSVGIAVAFNVVAGARVINLCFSSDPGGNVQPMATELDNVVGFDDGIASNGTGTSIMAGGLTGGLTPSVGGDLVYQIAASVSGTLNQSKFTAGSQANITWNLLSADLMDGWAGQYGVYLSTSAINPTMSMGTSGNWVSAAILLKSGNSGSVPSGMRIVHLEHENIPFHSSSGGTDFPFPNPLNLQFPCSGNLLVAMIGGGNASETVTSMSDTNLNTWAQAGKTQVIAGNDTVQAYYAGNATSSGNLGLTLNWTGGLGDFTIFFYDVTGASSSPLDTTAGNIGTQTVAGNLTMPSVTITPATPNEIVFAEVIWDSNTGTGLLGQLFDTNTFSGESLSGPEPVDENNGWGHLITTTMAPIGFTWTALPISLPVGNWAGMAVAFKAGP